MKSTRRHELQHNELDAELVKVLEFFKKYRSQISWGVLIVIVLAVGTWMWVDHSRGKVADVQLRYDQVMGVVPPPQDMDGQGRLQELQDLSNQTTDSRIAAMSALAIGDTHLQEVILAGGDLGGNPATEKATAAYNRVIDEFGAYPDLVASARYGLAKLAVSQGDFPAAKEAYEEILKRPELKGYPVYAMANQDLQTLGQLAQPIQLADVDPNALPRVGALAVASDFLEAVDANDIEEAEEFLAGMDEDSDPVQAARKILQAGDVKMDIAHLAVPDAIAVSAETADPNGTKGKVIVDLTKIRRFWRIEKVEFVPTVEAKAIVEAFLADHPAAKEDKPLPGGVEFPTDLPDGPVDANEPADGNAPVDGNDPATEDGMKPVG